MGEEQQQKERKENSAGKKSGYYINRPDFGQDGPSKIRQQLNRGMTAFVVIILCMLCFFALLRMNEITKVLRLILGILKPIIYGLAIAYLLNPIVKTVEHFLISRLKKKFPNFKKVETFSRGAGILVALIVMITIISA